MFEGVDDLMRVLLFCKGYFEDMYDMKMIIVDFIIEFKNICIFKKELKKVDWRCIILYVCYVNCVIFDIV